MPNTLFAPAVAGAGRVPGEVHREDRRQDRDPGWSRCRSRCCRSMWLPSASGWMSRIPQIAGGSCCADADSSTPRCRYESLPVTVLPCDECRRRPRGSGCPFPAAPAQTASSGSTHVFGLVVVVHVVVGDHRCRGSTSRPGTGSVNDRMPPVLPVASLWSAVTFVLFSISKPLTLSGRGVVVHRGRRATARCRSRCRWSRTRTSGRRGRAPSATGRSRTRRCRSRSRCVTAPVVDAEQEARRRRRSPAP